MNHSPVPQKITTTKATIKAAQTPKMMTPAIAVTTMRQSFMG
jgi:hypothetical protein